MTDTPLGPWPLGIDNISEVTALPGGTLADAVNGVIVTGGAFVRRNGELLLLNEPMHSTWQASSGRTYGVKDGVLGEIMFNPDLVFAPIYTLPDNQPVSFTELNGTVIFGSMSVLGQMTALHVVTLIGVEQPGAFIAYATSAGGLDEGTYGVAISYISATGEEGALSPVTFVTVETGGGIHLITPTPLEANTQGLRVYRTEANGANLYRVATIIPGTTLDLGVGSLGQLASTQYLSRTLPGRFVRAWQGRLLTARGRSLTLSEPLRYGLCDPRHGFVTFQHTIAWVEGIPSGVFIGTTGGTYFLEGAQPSEWALRLVDMSTPLYGASALLDAAMFTTLKLPEGVDYLATWLSGAGFAFGLPQGAVLRPQSNQVNIDLSGASGTLTVVGGVLTAIVQ